VLAAIHKYNTRTTTMTPESRVPVPRVFVLYYHVKMEDGEVIGTPFYIMEFLEGHIFTEMSIGFTIPLSLPSSKGLGKNYNSQ
jgi:hypothetical protein